jgi:hypothetical protein
MNDLRMTSQKTVNMSNMSLTGNLKNTALLIPCSSSSITTKPQPTQQSSSIISNSSNLENKNDFKKKKQPNVLPTIRFEIKLEKPSSEQFSELNYNKLVVKALKIVKKRSKKSSHTTTIEQTDATTTTTKKKTITTVNKNDLSILDDELCLEKEKIKDLLSTFRKKIVLSNENILLDDDNNLNQSELNGESNTVHSLTNDMDTDSMPPVGGNIGNTKKKSSKKPKKNLYDLDNNKYKLKNFEHLGKGYDEDDSFIDNSEAIEEQVPADMAPKRGGFYINKGNLKLEKINESKSSKSKNKQAASTKQAALTVANENSEEDEENDADYNENDEECSDEDDLGESGESDDDDLSDSDDDDDDSDNSDDDDESDEDEDSSNSESGDTDNSNIEAKAKHENGIEIVSSTTNSNSEIQINNNDADKKRKKRTRKVINDDDEEENESDENNQMAVVDEETIKENIENRNKLNKQTLGMPTNTPISNTMQANNGNNNNNMQYLNKKKRKTDSGPSTETIGGSGMMDGQLPSKMIRTVKEEESIQQQKKVI